MDSVIRRYGTAAEYIIRRYRTAAEYVIRRYRTAAECVMWRYRTAAENIIRRYRAFLGSTKILWRILKVTLKSARILRSLFEKSLHTGICGNT